MKRFNLILLTGLIFCIQDIYCQFDTINNYYFSNLRASLTMDNNVKEVKLVQEKVLHDKAFLQSMYVKYKDDPKQRFWHIGKEFVYYTINNKLAFISNVDIINKILLDSVFYYSIDGSLTEIEIHNVRYDSIVSIKRGNSFWSGIFGNYYEKVPNVFKTLEYSCSKDTVIERFYKYSDLNGFVINGNVTYYNRQNEILKKVHFDMGIEKPVVNIDSSRYGKYIDNRDGKTYLTIQIGNQTWLASNLTYKPDSGKYWFYNDSIENISRYGYLYNWETSKNVCPIDWHLPTKEEYEILLQNVGGTNGKTAYKELIPSGKSGFLFLRIGSRISKKNYSIMDCGLWSSTKKGRVDSFALYYCDYDPQFVMNGNIYKETGMPVRCIKNK